MYTELSLINLGKFGRIAAEDFYGLPFHATLELLKSDGKSRLAVCEGVAFNKMHHEGSIDEPKDNRDLLDDASAQRLSLEEIEELKKKRKGDEIVAEIVSNSITFESKTEFSKAKYLKRKQQKFLKLLRIKPITAEAMCSYFFKKNKMKIL